MKGLHTVIGKNITIHSDRMMDAIRGKITQHKPVNVRFCVLTIVDEFDMEWRVRVPNRALQELRTTVSHRGESFRIY